MDDHLRRKVSAFVAELVREERERFTKAETLYDLEGLTVEIGDEVSRQLAEIELRERATEWSSRTLHACPDCGRERPPEPDAEPVVLQSLRGEVTYLEPRCHCPTCRRDFFPSGRSPAPLAARKSVTTGDRESGVGRGEQRQLPVGGDGGRRTGGSRAHGKAGAAVDDRRGGGGGDGSR